MKTSLFKTRTFWTGLILILSSLYFGYISFTSGDQTQLTISIGNLITGIAFVFGRSAITEQAKTAIEIKQILEEIKSGNQPSAEKIEKIVDELSK